MEAEIIDIAQYPSKYGGWFWRIVFKDPQGKSYHTFVDPKNRNYRYWGKIIIKHHFNQVKGIPTKIENIRIKSGSLIDADSRVKVK